MDACQKNDWRYKRLRKSLRTHRDPQEFREAQAHLEIFERLEAQGECRVFHCDESGFSLTPLTPYAWQKGRRELTVAKEAGKRLNVIGFWSRQGHFLSVEQAQNVDLDTIMEVLEALSGTL